MPPEGERISIFLPLTKVDFVFCGVGIISQLQTITDDVLGTGKESAGPADMASPMWYSP